MNYCPYEMHLPNSNLHYYQFFFKLSRAAFITQAVVWRPLGRERSNVELSRVLKLMCTANGVNFLPILKDVPCEPALMPFSVSGRVRVAPGVPAATPWTHHTLVANVWLSFVLSGIYYHISSLGRPDASQTHPVHNSTTHQLRSPYTVCLSWARDSVVRKYRFIVCL